MEKSPRELFLRWRGFRKQVHRRGQSSVEIAQRPQQLPAQNPADTVIRNLKGETDEQKGRGISPLLALLAGTGEVGSSEHSE